MTSRERHIAWLLTAFILGLVHVPASADDQEVQDLEWVGEVTAGAKFYVLESPFDDDDVSSFFDQYRYIATEDESVPWYADAIHLDTGLQREDGTYLVRGERWSPAWINERGEVDLDWKGVDASFDYSRLRTDDLRVYPQSTRGRLPTDKSSYAANYQSDIDDAIGKDRRLFTRRTTAGGEVELRADDFGLQNSVLESARVYSRYQKRDGYRQDGFLLDRIRELGTDGQNRQRFRGNRRRFDQDVVVVGGGVTTQPADLFTGVIDVNFERFREHAPTVDLGDLAAEQPKLGTDLTTAQSDRAFNYVPDTNRITGSLQLSRRFGDFSVNAGANISHVEQSGNLSPLQELRDVDNTEIVDYATHFAFDAPFQVGSLDMAVGAFVKYRRRENKFDYENDIALITDEFRGAPDGQVDPFLKNRDQVDGEVEWTLRPWAGSLVGLGYRLHYVDRDWRYAEPPGTITPSVGFEAKESEAHTAFVRGRTRLGRATRISGELGFVWAPHTGFPTEFKRSQYFEGRASTTIPVRIANSLTAFGRVEHGSNDDFKPQGESADTTQRKKYDRTSWNAGITAQVVPWEDMSFFTSYVHSQDHQDFRHVRSNIPRYSDPNDLKFFIDSNIDYDANVDVLSLGTETRWNSWLGTRIATILTWVEADFKRDTPAGLQLDELGDVNDRIVSAETGVSLYLPLNTRVDLGYRFDQFHNKDHDSPLNLDEDVHTISIAFTVAYP